MRRIERFAAIGFLVLLGSCKKEGDGKSDTSLLNFPINQPAPAPAPAPDQVEMQGENAESMALLSTALPTESADIVIPPGTDEPGQGWSVLSGGSVQSRDEIQSIVDVLRTPVTMTPNVEEIFNENAAGQTAVSTCKGSRHVIYYSQTALAQYDARTTEFIRQHELAHHRLGQVVCSGPEPKFPNYNEKAADCAATSALLAEGQHGHDVLISIGSVLFFMNRPAKGLYPATQERADYIEKGCK